MHLYRNFYHCEECLGGVKKWKRTLEALGKVREFPANEAHSIGDSLTYWWNYADKMATGVLVGHRRYLTVLSPLVGSVCVRVAPQTTLVSLQPYSDITDRESFGGDAMQITVEEGGVLVLDIDEAADIVPDDSVKVAQVQVTVEGYSFPNK